MGNMRYPAVIFSIMMMVLLRQTRAQIISQCQLMDLAIVVPTSRSPTDWTTVKNFLANTLNRLDILSSSTAMRVAVVTYRGTAMLNINFNQYSNKGDLLNAVRNMPQIQTDGTNVRSALAVVANTLFSGCPLRPDSICNALILFDDNDYDETDLDVFFQNANLSGIQYQTMGLNPFVNVDYGGFLPGFNSSINRIYPSIDDLPNDDSDAANFICTFKPPLCVAETDIAFILDQSTSILAASGGMNNWYSMLSFVQQVATAFPISPALTRIGLSKFSDIGTYMFGFNTYSSLPQVLRAIGDLQIMGGNTDIADGFHVSNTEVLPTRRRSVKTIVILITDGQPDVNVDETFVEINVTKGMGIDVFAIGITNAVDVDQMTRMASSPAEDYFYFVNDYNQIVNALTQLTAYACLITSGSSTTPLTTTSTRTTPTSTTTTVTTTPTTTTTTTTQSNIPCSQNLDIVYMVDTTYLSSSQVQAVQQYLASLTSSLPVGPRVQVGAMTYSSNPMMGVRLGQYNYLSGVLSALQNMSYASSGSTTNTAAALTYLRNSMFSTANGARTGVARLGVLISSNNANNVVSAVNEADLTRRAGIDLVTIPVGTWLDVTQFQKIASFYGMYQTNTIPVTSGYNALSSALQPVQTIACGNNVCQNSPCLNGGQCINRPSGAFCSCQQNWGGLNCENSCSSSGDLIFVVDSSGSIGKNNFQVMLNFIQTIVDNLDVDYSLFGNSNRGFRIGLMTYSSSVNVFFQLNSNYSNKMALLSAMNVPYIDGTTATDDAIRIAANQMFTEANGSRANQGIPQYMMVITDGSSNVPSATWNAAVQARAKGINIMAVGVGSYNYTELQGIASAPESANVITATFATLNTQLAKQIATTYCQNINYCSSNPCQNGATCTSSLGGYSCYPCPSSFSGVNCQTRCSGKIDLIFIVDASGSIQFERMNYVLDFLATTTQSLDIGPLSTQIGAVYFSSSATVAFPLGTYSNRQDNVQALRSIPYLGGRTNLADAQRKARTGVIGLSGDRADAPNVVVFFTDGNDNVETESTLSENVLLKNTGTAAVPTVIITVSVGAQGFVNFTMLNLLASSPTSRNVISTTRFGWMQSNLTLPLLAGICNDVNECQPNPCQNGGRCNDGFGMSTCTCVTPFLGYTCDRLFMSSTGGECNQNIDVVFALDLSGSVYDANMFNAIFNFTKAVVIGLPANARVGLVTFDSNAYNVFYLSTYVSYTKLQLLNAIQFMPTSGTTNAQAALSTVRTAQFTSANGNRAGSPKILIYVSDGHSNAYEGNSPNNNAQLLKNTGVTIFSVGLTDSPNWGELNNIASNGTVQYYLDSTHGYTDTANSLLGALCR